LQITKPAIEATSYLQEVSFGYLVIQDSLMMTGEEGMVFCDLIGKVSIAGH